jgi:uncharacterized protein (DUF1778 family)
MSTSRPRRIRIATLRILTPPETYRLLTMAAAVRGQDLATFVLESALHDAHDVLADRRVFRLPAADWISFLDALDAPARPLPRWTTLLTTDSVFEAGTRPKK